MSSDKNKWDSQHIAKHFKNQKNLSHWRHNKYRQRKKKFTRKHTRSEWLNCTDEDEFPGCNADTFMFWKHCHQPVYDRYHKRYVKQRKYIKRQHDKAVYTDIICNHNFTFTHDIHHLRSLKPDVYLKSKVIISYWNKRLLQFQGEITCISHLGLIKLQDVQYMGDARAAQTQYGLPAQMHNAYWFHYKCIDSIVMYKTDTNGCDFDITAIMMDLMKLKVMLWFKTEMSRRMENLRIGVVERALQVEDIVNVRSMDTICEVFWQEQERINPFVLYLPKYKSIQQAKLKFTKDDLAHIIYEYHKQDSRHTATLQTAKMSWKMSYLNWDSNTVEKLTKRKCIRTV